MEQLSFINKLCLTEISLVHNYLADAGNYPMHNSGRSHQGLLYTVSGTETYHFADKTLQAVPNSVVFIPKGEAYTITFSGEKSNVWTVDFEMTPCEPIRPFAVKFPERNRAGDCFMAMAAAQKRTSSAALEKKSRFYALLALIAGAMEVFLPSTSYEKIAQAVEVMHEHGLQNDFRLQALAKEAGVSYRYFESLFRRKYGISPKEYLLSLRLDKAKELLTQSDMPIGEIALAVGCGDSSHFGKLFAAKTGYTPREYRRMAH